MTLFTTSIRLIKASITGAIGGAKDAITLEKQFMAWEEELETLEVFDGYQGWIEVADDDIPVSHQQQDECMNCYNSNQDEIVADFLSDENQTEIFCKRGFGCNHDDATATCIGCDNIIQYDICEPFCKECIAQSHETPDFSEYHMDTCCIEATGVCNCELPF